MQKTVRLFSLVVLLFVILATTYYLSDKAPSADLPIKVQTQEILTSGGCISCHSEKPDLPFYASLPAVGALVKEDVDKGYDFFDIQPLLASLENGTTPNEADLAKVEKSISDRTMPIVKYSAVHWGASINCAEKAMVMKWVKEERSKLSTGLASPELKNEPICPIPEKAIADTAIATLGKLLYHDTRLSGDNSVACATCHGLNTAGVDNLAVSKGINGQLGGINDPTTFNACFNFVQFWDGRAADLQAQAAGPPLNPIEMGSKSFEEIARKLADDPEMVALFAKLYPEGINQNTITGAIAEFEKTLITPNSAFDKFLKGDSTALTEQQLTGYETFKDMGCATCHVGVNMGGQSFEKLGLWADYFADRKKEINDGDKGRFGQTNIQRDMHRFKVPSLRNIALTYPYFHDASKSTLEEAVDAMAKYQSNKQLTEEEKAGMIAFLESLTGEFEGKLLSIAK